VVGVRVFVWTGRAVWCGIWAWLAKVATAGKARPVQGDRSATYSGLLARAVLLLTMPLTPLQQSMILPLMGIACNTSIPLVDRRGRLSRCIRNVHENVRMRYHSDTPIYTRCDPDCACPNQAEGRDGWFLFFTRSCRWSRCSGRICPSGRS
jgi:hypothetical protein